MKSIQHLLQDPPTLYSYNTQNNEAKNMETADNSVCIWSTYVS